MLVAQYPLAIMEKEDRLSPNLPFVVFSDLFLNEAYLAAQSGYNPIKLKLSVVSGNQFPCKLAVEMALPPFEFIFNGARFVAMELGGKANNFLMQGANATAHYNAKCGAEWDGSTLVLEGDPNIVTLNEINLQTILAKAEVGIRAVDDITKSPILRLRRSYDTAVIDEDVGDGDDTTQTFTFTLANAPICPSSVKVTFEDATAVYTHKIRDDGHGKFVTLPPTVLTNEKIASTINYQTGVCVLSFSGAHIPKLATDILVSYEYSASGIPDKTEYKVNWSLDL